MTRKHDADRRRQERIRRHEHGEVEEDREHEVHRRPGEHDEEAFVDRQRLEGPLAVLRMHDLGLRLLEHRDVTAERQKPDAVFRLTPSEAQDLRSEPETEREHLHAKRFGEHEVPELVNEDQRAREDDEIDEIHRTGAARTLASKAAPPKRLVPSRRRHKTPT